MQVIFDIFAFRWDKRARSFRRLNVHTL